MAADTGSLTLDFDELTSSSVALATVGLLAIAIIAAVLEGVTTVGPSRDERFVRYLAFFEERQAEWMGLMPEASMLDRLLRHLTVEHSLLRLFNPPFRHRFRHPLFACMLNAFYALLIS